MTMILAVATPAFVVLAADRGQTRLDPDGTITPCVSEREKVRPVVRGWGAHAGFAAVGEAVFTDARPIRPGDGDLPARMRRHHTRFMASQPDLVRVLPYSATSTFVFAYADRAGPLLSNFDVPGSARRGIGYSVTLPPGIPRSRCEEISRELARLSGERATLLEVIRALARAALSCAQGSKYLGQTLDVGIVTAEGRALISAGAAELASASDADLGADLAAALGTKAPSVASAAVDIRGYNEAGVPGAWYPVDVQSYAPPSPVPAGIEAVTLEVIENAGGVNDQYILSISTSGTVSSATHAFRIELYGGGPLVHTEPAHDPESGPLIHVEPAAAPGSQYYAHVWLYRLSDDGVVAEVTTIPRLRS